MPPVIASAPAERAVATRRPAPRGEELLSDYVAALAARGAGNRSFVWAARAFLTRWPDPQAWAEQPLPVRLSAGSAVRPLLTYLMLTGYLRPGYDYLLERKLAAILREAHTSPVAGDVTRFLSAATELGYSPQIAAGLATQVAVRMLIQTGHPLSELDDTDIAEFTAAITAANKHINGNSSTTGPRCMPPALCCITWVGKSPQLRKTPRICVGRGGVTSPVFQPDWLIRWSPTWNAPRALVPDRPCWASPAAWGISPSSSQRTIER
jgi:hypothetical protein